MLIYHYPRKVNSYKSHIHNISLLGQTVTLLPFNFKLYLSRSKADVTSSRRSLIPAGQINCFLSRFSRGSPCFHRHLERCSNFLSICPTRLWALGEQELYVFTFLFPEPAEYPAQNKHLKVTEEQTCEWIKEETENKRGKIRTWGSTKVPIFLWSILHIRLYQPPEQVFRAQ